MTEYTVFPDVDTAFLEDTLNNWAKCGWYYVDLVEHGASHALCLILERNTESRQG